MREKSILFTSDNANAILDGRKTQTRRAIKTPRKRDAFTLIDRGDGWWPYQSDDGESALCSDGNEHPYACPYGQPGDRIYVKETYWAWGRWETRFDAKKGRDAWHFVDMTRECGKSYQFKQPAPIGTRGGVSPAWRKRPSLFMPRHASRILLEVVAVRVERLQEISEADAIAEGIASAGLTGCSYGVPGMSKAHYLGTAREAFECLWISITGPDSWDTNPWVWVVEFRRIGAEEKSA